MDLIKVDPRTKGGKKSQNDRMANVMLADRPFILISAPIDCGDGKDEIVAIATTEGGTSEELMKSIVTVMECHEGFTNILIEAVGRFAYLQASKKSQNDESG